MNRVRRAYDVQHFLLTANDFGFSDISHRPLLEVTQRHLLVVLSESQLGNQQQ